MDIARQLLIYFPSNPVVLPNGQLGNIISESQNDTHKLEARLMQSGSDLLEQEQVEIGECPVPITTASGESITTITRSQTSAADEDNESTESMNNQALSIYNCDSMIK